MAIDPITGAMTSRIVQIFNCPNLQLFFKTGQPSGTQRFDGLGERKASISCIPYRTTNAAQHVELERESQDIEKSRVTIRLHPEDREIEFYDGLTKVSSRYSFDLLDEVVRQRVDTQPIQRNIPRGPK